ncbi:MAG TPA: hypothetical protein VLL54_06465 [Pyrinomonadaceae bacterium]|nr:hypothetical protein [Pyrinomonadaceae bacterium]
MPNSSAPKRPRFFDSKLLTVSDLELEQNYFREKHKLHNRSLHGFGVVSGLAVTAGSGKVVVQPGLALDCEGNEILIESTQSVNFTGLVSERVAYLALRYVEQFVDPVPVATGGEENSSVVESFELAIAQENCNRGHRRLRGRWLPCGTAHALTIAKLRATSQGWRVDRRYRPPMVK